MTYERELIPRHTYIPPEIANRFKAISGGLYISPGTSSLGTIKGLPEGCGPIKQYNNVFGKAA